MGRLMRIPMLEAVLALIFQMALWEEGRDLKAGKDRRP
jgi:hypothetical protein